MRKTYRKNTRRTIKETFGRFAAIFAIVALGVGFLAGLLSATPDMRDSFDRYFDNASMYDIEIIGDLGLSEADVAELRRLEGIENVQAGYLADVLMSSKKGNDFTVRMHSLNTNAQGSIINQPVLTSGRFPDKSNECLIINVPLGSKTKFKIGDTLKVSDYNKNTDDILNSTEYAVVGFADYSPNFSAEKEYTNIGSGTVDLFILVPNDSFATDFYTDIFITVNGAKELTALTGSYQSYIENATGKIESISEERCEIRYTEVKKESAEKLTQAKEDYADAKTEAEVKLSDAAKQIEDGWDKIEDGENKLLTAWSQITKNEKALIKSEADLKEQEISATREFAEAEKKFDDAQSKIDSNLKAVISNLSTAENELALFNLSAPQKSAFDELRKLLLTYPSLSDDLTALREKSERLKEIGARLIEISALPLDQQAKLSDEVKAFMNEKNALETEINKITSGKAYTAYANSATRLAMTGAVSDKLPPLALKLGSIDVAKQQLEKVQSDLNTQLADFSAKKATTLKDIEEGYEKISDGKLEISKAKSTYFKELAKLNNAKNTLTENQRDYDNAKSDTEKELTDGWQEISDAEKELADLKAPEWHVLTREDNISYSSIKANIDKVDAIARVFPFFFFLVAALVALTTMTRMVEDDRLQIGTMKALGYSRSAIMWKYILYALAASTLGSVVGVAIGFRLFPTVIWNVYTMMYELPHFYCPINWIYAVSTSSAVILCTLLATANACRATLKEKPAQLMLPKAPEAGKRVLLERITPIWSRMKFTHKVTARNLFRYKKRFFMTIIGVAGCTSLLVTGFGLRDSFSVVSEMQFGELNTYEILAPIKDKAALENPKLQNLLSDKSVVSGSIAVNLENVTATNGKNSIDVLTFIPEKASDFQGFVNFRNRASGNEIGFDEDSVIITEKASEVLNVKTGDVITLTDIDGKSGDFKISGICENYVRNYIYMSEGTYLKSMGENAELNTLAVRLVDNSSESESNFGKKLLETDLVSGVRLTSDSRDAVSKALGNINMIVVVIIISAGALALVVLYNLTNINISERIKEIATIKVLGFTDREVDAYINRESILLSIIGTMFGLFLGVFLHRYVMGKAEMDIMMFGRSVKAMSFIFSAALTMVFSIIIDIIMGRKLRKISMVESMKAPE